MNEYAPSDFSSPAKKRMKTVIKQEPLDAIVLKTTASDSTGSPMKIESLDGLIGAQDPFGTKRKVKHPKRKRMSDLAKFPMESSIKKEHSIKKEQESSVKKEPSIKKEGRKKSLSEVRTNLEQSEDVLEAVGDLIDEFKTKVEPTKQTKSDNVPKKKKNPYGLSPGESPFPDFKMPTPEAAREVTRLLSEAHGVVVAPKTLEPSLDASGCGEVPCVLDALIRTLLSAATTNKNSSNAFQGLVKRFGLYTSGVGKGSVNWNRVRDAPVEDIEEAIRSGGLAKAKSKNIKKILDIVYETNQARRKALLEAKKTGHTAAIVGADTETKQQKVEEVETSDSHVLSLQYVHELSTEDAMTELLKMPGVGVKVSSCVILFCLRRPSFAVDTHVWRLCKWLKWVPPKATRDQTFSHCEVRIPNELKYALHKLLIRHGRTCPRCRAAVSSKNEAWASTKCPIEHLVSRMGTRKGT